MQPPEPYVVYYQDWGAGERLAKQQGIDTADVDPAEFEEQRDFLTLAAAHHFACNRPDARIERRVNVHWVDDPLYRYDWDQEEVE